MSKRIIYIFALFLTFLITLVMPPKSIAITGSEIALKMDTLLRGDTAHGIYEMKITNPKWKRTLTMETWEVRKEKKSFIRILSPKKEKGIGTLKIDTEMWNYLPRVERTIKIPPSMMMNSWMGSDFTNDDLVKESSIVDDYTHTLLDTVTFQKHKTYKVEAIPHEDTPVVWGKIISWVRTSDFIPLKQEFYDEKGGLIRVLNFNSIKKIGNRNFPTHWEMIPVKKEGKKTEITIINIEFDKPISDDVFTLRNLKK